MTVQVGGVAAKEVEEVEAEVMDKHSMYGMVFVEIADVVQRLQPVTVQDIVRSHYDHQEPGVSEGIGPTVAVALIDVGVYDVVVTMTSSSVRKYHLIITLYGALLIINSLHPLFSLSLSFLTCYHVPL